MRKSLQFPDGAFLLMLTAWGGPCTIYPLKICSTLYPLPLVHSVCSIINPKHSKVYIFLSKLYTCFRLTVFEAESLPIWYKIIVLWQRQKVLKNLFDLEMGLDQWLLLGNVDETHHLAKCSAMCLFSENFGLFFLLWVARQECFASLSEQK